MLGRKILAITLCLFLAVPVWAGPGPVGAVSGARAAKISGATVEPGTTLFSGDTLQVGKRGSAWIALAGGGHIHVGENSEVRISKESEAVQIELRRGAFSFRATEKPLAGRLADATIRSAGDEPAVGTILMVEENKAVVAAEKGTLSVRTAHNGRSVMLKEGESVTLALVPAAAAGGGSGLSGKQVAILGAIAGAIISVIAIVQNERSPKLTNQQKKDAVSPFRFP